MRHQPVIPDAPLAFIRRCCREGKVQRTYHVNKYLPSYLLLSRHRGAAFHVLFAADVAGHSVRIVTAYRPDPGEWEADLKTRKARP